MKYPQERRVSLLIITILAVSILLTNTMVISSNTSGESTLDSRSSMKSASVMADDDVVVSIEKNATYLGKSQVCEINVSISNHGSESISNVEVVPSFYGSSAGFSEVIGFENDSWASLSTGESGFMQMHVKVSDAINQSSVYAPVDLVLAIDASSSMGDEITAIQNELIDLVKNMSAEIPELRFGVIVYGWREYGIEGQYPSSEPGNYLEFTTSTDQVIDFISGLYASGGVEPWGDALALANMWEWRADAVRMIILVGDEDCDPGRLVGVEDPTAEMYNGTELVAVVDSLASKFVKINTVICSGADENTINQFQWIARATSGTSVFLGTGWPTGDDVYEVEELPYIIEDWAVNASHEDVGIITVEVSYEDDVGHRYDVDPVQSIIWLDLVPPVISVTRQSIIDDNEVTITLVARPEDLSGIKQVVLYYKIENSLWNLIILEKEADNRTYIHNLPVVVLYTNITYYFTATDTCGNIVTTDIVSVLADIESLPLGMDSYYEMINNSRLALNIPMSSLDEVYHIMLFSDELINITMLQNPGPSEDTIANATFLKAWHFVESGMNDTVHLVLETTNSTSVRILFLTEVILDQLENVEGTLDLDHSIELYVLEVSEADLVDNWQMWITYPSESGLIATVRVFNENWTLVVSFDITPVWDITENGTYYILMERAYRTGAYTLVINPLSSHTATTTTTFDWRSYASTAAGTTAPTMPAAPTATSFGSLLVAIGLLGWVVWQRRRKK